MPPTIAQTVPLGDRWPTVDPFLFCAHHRDRYPRANAVMGPDASLSGRDLGMDFAGQDGWNMYHGSSVPGFPQHPHRGFETITFVRRGIIDHADSLGSAARFGRGDVQWMTAGSGIVHSEMFPLLRSDEDNPLELFQIWLNLPASDKLVEPYFTMFWDGDLPKVGGPGVIVTVIAGALEGAMPLSPPPNSWAAKPESDVALWHIQLEDGATFTLPPAASAQTVRTVYAFSTSGLNIGEDALPGGTGGVVFADHPITLTASDGPTECLVLQGRPLDEPVAQYGPFVMTTQQELRDAMTDYQQTQFGGWPWDRDDPVHPHSQGRFARHADGHTEAGR